MNIVKSILSILIPPLGVFLKSGLGSSLFMNVLLTILGYIPGVIHALIVVNR